MIAGHGAADFLTDTDAVAQAVLTRLRLLLGEWWEDLEDGLPLYQNILRLRNGQDQLTAAELLIRDRILRTDGVAEILALESAFDSADRQIAYKAAVKTVYGALDLDSPAVQDIDPGGFQGEDYFFHTHLMPPITGRIIIGGTEYEMEPVAAADTGYVTVETYLENNFSRHTHTLPPILGRVVIDGRAYAMTPLPAGETAGVDTSGQTLTTYASHAHRMPPLAGRLVIGGDVYYMEPADAGATGDVNERR
jgi:hypothetical protein